MYNFTFIDASVLRVVFIDKRILLYSSKIK
jgi:hypothetical protein